MKRTGFVAVAKRAAKVANSMYARGDSSLGIGAGWVARRLVPAVS